MTSFGDPFLITSTGGVSRLKIRSLATMGNIAVDVNNGFNVFQAKLFSKYILYFYTGIESNIKQNFGFKSWVLKFTNRSVERGGEDEPAHSCLVTVEDNGTEISIRLNKNEPLTFLLNGRRAQQTFSKPGDAIIVEGSIFS